MTALNPRTSLSHPLSVSWLFPGELLEQPLPPAGCDILDALLDLGAPHCHPSGALAVETPIPIPDAYGSPILLQDSIGESQAQRSRLRRGNIGLSSCPGKQVRLEINPNVAARASIKRDLVLDFYRLFLLGVRAVVW